MTDREKRPSDPWTAGRTEQDQRFEREGLLFSPSEWPLVLQTLQNMKPVQLAGIAERHLRHAIVPKLPIDFDERYEDRIPQCLSVSPSPLCENLSTLRSSLSEIERRQYRRAAAEAAAGRYTFLKQTIDFGDRIDWDHEAIDEQPLFWRLKLEGFEGFEWLLLGEASPSTVDDLRSSLERQALRWDAENPIGERSYLRRSWIPHSVSLRVLHWCRYLAWCAGDDDATAPDRLPQIAYKNALFLANHVEHEIGGNHLLENAVALVAAGVLFSDHDTGWERTGLDLFETAARTQFLADGGHFERSPMYHVTVLRRYATVCDLLSEMELRTTAIKRTAEAAMGFLCRLIGPGGEIPLLNDSVHAEAIDATSCLSYCQAVGLSASKPPLESTTGSGSGYRLLSTDAGTLLFDVGDVGPPHLPAHSHNDQLSVLLWIDGNPILADTGVYDYAANRRRQYARSVVAHNTAQYDTTEPIPIGGSYLMGRRTSISLVTDKIDSITAQNVRHSVVGPEYEHRRTVATTGAGWQIVDALSGDEGGRYTVRYHFHPTVEINPSRSHKDRFDIRSKGERVGSVRFTGVDQCRLSQSPYFPEYGTERRRAMVVASAPTETEICTTFDSVATE